MQDATGKLPPRDTEMEEVVLGALMLEKDAYMNVADILTADAFYDPVNAMIYEAISTLGLNQRPIDMMSVKEQLRRDGNLEKAGGAVHITELTARVLSAANVEYHAKIVAQKFLARRLISFASKIETEAFDESNDVDDLLQEAEGELFNISQTHLKREVTQIDPVLNLALEQIQTAANAETGLSGLQTGYTGLDKMTSGWQNSDLIIIAARPAMGKTAFVLSMAKNMAIDYNIPVAIFTLEMANVQLVKRLISNIADLEGEKIKSGQLTPDEWDRLNSRIRLAFSAPLYLDETPGLSITELRTKARRLVRETYHDRLPPADERHRHETGKPRAGGVDHIALAQGSRQGTQHTDHRAVAAEPKHGDTRGQAAGSFRSPRVGRHRAGCRHRMLHPPPGVLHQEHRRRQRQ